MKLSVKSIDELPEVAQSILNFLGETRVVTLEGDLGTGKTTLVKYLAQTLGSKDTAQSPSYGIIHEYHYGNNEKIFHADLYRIKSEEECWNLGIEEMLQSGNWIFIEWPDMAQPFIETPFAKIKISANGFERTFDIEKIEK